MYLYRNGMTVSGNFDITIIDGNFMISNGPFLFMNHNRGMNEMIFNLSLMSSVVQYNSRKLIAYK